MAKLLNGLGGEFSLIVLQPTTYCNIDCAYCYLRRRDEKVAMPEPVLAAINEQILSRLAEPALNTVVWHGGEPLAAGIQWFRRAYGIFGAARSRGLRFSLQTNGIALDDEWLRLFQETDTGIGLSIDGPREWHDARRKTRSGKGTHALAMTALARLQAAGFEPGVISVISAAALVDPEAFYLFCRDNQIRQVSLSIDEAEGANAVSSHGDGANRQPMSAFVLHLLTRAWSDGYELAVKEVERIAACVAGATVFNEQTVPWGTVTIAADGSVFTFSPEMTEWNGGHGMTVPFGNILVDTLEDCAAGPSYLAFAEGVEKGVAACRESCAYFGVCGGGSPINKLTELGRLDGTETAFCRLTTMAAADAFAAFAQGFANQSPSVSGKERQSAEMVSP